MLGRGIGRRRRGGLLRTVGRTAVVVGTATAVHGAVQEHQDKKAQTEADAEASQQEQAAAPQQSASAPPPAADTSMNDLLKQLKELGQLKADGVLTEDEFATQKARLLGS
jgi:pyruvate/2-oxoglutarate dehydrogenase complex dihydrolipoamide acyltransferase (E2) component